MGLMEKKMETAIMGYIGRVEGFYGGYVGVMEKNMQNSSLGFGVWGLRFGHFVRGAGAESTPERTSKRMSPDLLALLPLYKPV